MLKWIQALRSMGTEAHVKLKFEASGHICSSREVVMSKRRYATLGKAGVGRMEI